MSYFSCDDNNLKNSETWESPGPLRLLPIFQSLKRTLGLRESPSGLGESRATEATANISNFQKETHKFCLFLVAILLLSQKFLKRDNYMLTFIVGHPNVLIPSLF